MTPGNSSCLFARRFQRQPNEKNNAAKNIALPPLLANAGAILNAHLGALSVKESADKTKQRTPQPKHR